MANLANADQVGMLSREDSLYIIQGGKVKRITADKLSEQINQGDEALLRQVAWGIPIKQAIQSDPHWGTLGNWDLYAEYKAKVGRYLVKPDGTAAKLNRTDSSVYADGTQLDETKGNVMVIGPRLYYRVQDDALAGCPVLWMSEQPIGGHWLSNAGEHNCYAAYKGTLDGSRLVSRRGGTTSEAKNISQWWIAAQVNGSNWGILDYDGWRWYCMLCMCEAEGNMNIQDALGYGLKGNNGTNGADLSGIVTGATASLGDATGAIPASSITATSCHVNVCGIEDFYGNRSHPVQGIYFSKGNTKTAYAYKGNRIPSSAEFDTHPSGEYRQIELPEFSKSYAAIRTLKVGEQFDTLMASEGSSFTTYWCDIFYWTNDGQVLKVGTGMNGSVSATNGPFTQDVQSTNSASVPSPFLAYYGKLKFTDGRNI